MSPCLWMEAPANVRSPDEAERKRARAITVPTGLHNVQSSDTFMRIPLKRHF